MTVSGSKKAVDALLWEGGALSAGKGIHFGDGDIKVTITAPRLSALILNSAADAKLADHSPCISKPSASVAQQARQGRSQAGIEILVGLSLFIYPLTLAV